MPSSGRRQLPRPLRPRSVRMALSLSMEQTPRASTGQRVHLPSHMPASSPGELHMEAKDPGVAGCVVVI